MGQMANGQMAGSVAIVTGAGRGIGRAIAKVYAREGAKVAVVSRTPATLDAVVAEITAEGGTAIGIPCDVGSKEQVFAAVDRTLSAFGTVDVLVNNAQGFGTQGAPRASTKYMTVEEYPDDEIEYIFRTGAMATLWGMQAVFPTLKAKGWGKIINFSSTSGILGTTGNTAYNMTKEAIRSLSRTAANEWGQFGINVNVISPTLKTDAFDAWEVDRPEFVKALREALPMRRLGDPEADGGPLAVFLAGHGSDFITGMTFMLNGGKLMP
jgi:NAD(P)-dependent dehydrogenase (short-subunit alcohol dehydrogenase family)